MYNAHATIINSIVFKHSLSEYLQIIFLTQLNPSLFPFFHFNPI